MSIWHSTTVSVGSVPDRDNYTGEDDDDAPTILVDVASAKSYHRLIRLCVDGAAGNSGEALISIEEAVVLQAALSEAIAEINEWWKDRT